MLDIIGGSYLSMPCRYGMGDIDSILLEPLVFD
jgi:hypothetical protein